MAWLFEKDVWVKIERQETKRQSTFYIRDNVLREEERREMDWDELQWKILLSHHVCGKVLTLVPPLPEVRNDNWKWLQNLFQYLYIVLTRIESYCPLACTFSFLIPGFFWIPVYLYKVYSLNYGFFDILVCRETTIRAIILN